MIRARMELRFLGILMLLAAISLPTTVLPDPAHAQASIQNTRCRRALHSGMQRLFRTTLAKQASCHRQRMLGKFSPLRNCTNPDTLPNSQILDVIEGHLLRRARNSCDGTPASLGYKSCDAPCANIPIVTFTDVGRCIGCLAKEEARVTTQDLYGTPPVPGRNTDAVRCQTTIGADNIRYATSLLTSQRRCQYLQDRGAFPASVDCRRDDVFFMFQRAREVLTRRMEDVCDFQQTSTLDGCKKESNTLDCIIDRARTSTDVLYRQVYQGEQFRGARIVFVTSEAFPAADLGGLAGADAICQAAAANSVIGLDGTFRAWLSAGNQGPATRFTKSTQPYILTNGTRVAANFDELVTLHPEVAINLDENGNEVVFERPVWSGTDMSGQPASSQVTCSGWTSGTGIGVVGLPYFIGGGLWSNAGALRCGASAHLYCFQQ